MTQLLKGNASISECTSLKDWQQKALQQFAFKLTNSKCLFPCIPATQGYHFCHFQYGFASDPRTFESSKELATMLKAYGKNSQDFGKYSSLIIFFETPNDLVENNTIEDFECLFWSLLKNVHSFDEKPWPKEIPKNPFHHAWEFCFDNERYFIYCATPKHQLRLSRHFPFFLLAITPRWVLEQFHSDENKSERTKKLIRERLLASDHIAPHPELKWYGQKDNYEWKQYFLRDDNSPKSACPFAHLWKD
ncbi:YqcI/YcgG family protein [Halalkalibacterium ligniniphilum]|uniref:YqcI/YcgG family protein n=1 Tax=Halalkalibacterium ligniniphilum TaxID=1134413 RepID=UPI0003455798|nr:YqcI/YcgG family protein [Halalkalibacterium ligniniphilum]